MSKTKTENHIQVIESLPRIIQDEDILKSFIKEKIKEGLRDGFKDLMKESFNEILGERRVKEILEEQEQAKIEKAKQEEMRKFMEDLKEEVELNKRNPQLRTQEVAELLGVTRSTIYHYIKQGLVKGEQDSYGTWWFRQNDILAFRDCFAHLIKPRPARRKRDDNAGQNKD